MEDIQLAAAITVLYIIILNLMFISYHLLMTAVLQRNSEEYYL